MSLVLLCSLAVAEDRLLLSLPEALERAGAHNPSVENATQSLIAADGSLLAAQSSFGPSVSGETAWYASTNEGSGQFGEYYADLSGWSATLGASQGFATGTALSLNLENTQSKYLYRLKGLDSEFTDEPQYQSKLSVSVSQSLLQGLGFGYNLQAVRAARSAISVAEANRQTARQTVLAGTAKAYWALSHARRLADIARQTASLQRAQGEVVTALVGAGRLADVERLRMEAAIAQADRAVLLADDAAATAEDALVVLIGETPGATVELTTSPEPPQDLSLDPADVVNVVLQGNPELVALRIQADAAAAAVRADRQGLLPDLVATGSYNLQGYAPSLGGAWEELGSATLPGWSLGARVDVPLLNQADRGALQGSQAAEAQAQIAVRSLEASLAEQARGQVRTVTSARENVRLCAQNVRLQEATLLAERARVEEGRALQKDLIQAVRDLDNAKVEAEGASADYETAIIELMRLEGKL